MKLPTGFNYWS